MFLAIYSSPLYGQRTKSDLAEQIFEIFPSDIDQVRQNVKFYREENNFIRQKDGTAYP